MTMPTGGWWWVVGDANTLVINVVQSQAKPKIPPTGEVFGPYTTKAEADAVAKQQGSGGGIGSFAAGAAAGAQGALGGAAVPVVGDPLSFLGYLGEIGHWIGTFVTDITDVHMWISLGWLFLGFVLLIIGLLLFLKHEDLLPKAAPVPIPVPI